MRIAHRIRIFVDRYPWLGPLIYVLSIEFFYVQVLAANAWTSPYSWRFNMISDLGNTSCGVVEGVSVCSPLHPLMNLSLFVIGMTMAIGSPLIYHEFHRNRGTLVGFSLMTISGLGAIIVGLFPENTILPLHLFGAGLTFGLGNLSLVILALTLDRVSTAMRVYTFLSGAIALIALGFFIFHFYDYLGAGGLERVVAYPQAAWLVIFGLYMSRDHILYMRTFKKFVHRQTERI